jgi:hypothetical protein
MQMQVREFRHGWFNSSRQAAGPIPSWGRLKSRPIEEKWVSDRGPSTMGAAAL